jgi:alpha-tubulin suppressor-like RCC1 family protein
LKNDGTVWSWGIVDDGQMGNGKDGYNPNDTDLNSTSWVPIEADISNVKEVSAGSEFTVALKNDGTVWAWGSGGLFTDYMALQNNTSPAIYWSPTQVKGLSNITSVASGQDNAVALDNEGRVWTWGTNMINTTNFSDTGLITTPVQVPIINVKAIADGNGFSLALKNDGTVWGWGDDMLGELGDGGSYNVFTIHDITRSTPVMVQGLTNVVAIATSDQMSLALKNDGTVWEWGRPDTNTVYTTPIQIPINNVVAIACGMDFGLALKSDGTVWAWGDNNLGQLGIGTTSPSTSKSTTPVQVLLGNIQTTNTTVKSQQTQPVNSGASNTLGNMLSPMLVVGLAGLIIIGCIAYYIKRNR